MPESEVIQELREMDRQLWRMRVRLCQLRVEGHLKIDTDSANKVKIHLCRAMSEINEIVVKIEQGE